MSFEKPCRICNHLPLAAPVSLPAVTANLKEVNDRYELRITIPQAGRRSYFVIITGGTLYVYEENTATPDHNLLLASLTLPANVLQARVIALYRPYGLKILMPIAAQDGATIQVPLIRGGLV